MAVLVKCPDCQALRALTHKECPGCGYDLIAGRKNKKVKYYTRLYVSSLKKHQTKQYEKLADAQKAEREFQRLKDENPGADSVIVLNENTTVNNLLDWYMELHIIQQQAQYRQGSLQPRINLLKKHLGSVMVSQLKRSMLEDLQSRLLHGDPPRSQSYTDQVIGLLKAVINRAVDDDLLLASCVKPFRKMNKSMSCKRANARKRILRHSEYAALMNALPHHLKPVVAMGYWTGMRIGEILNLTWDKVNLFARMIELQSSDTKEKRPKEIPILDDRLFEMLKVLPKGLHDNHVILYRGRPILKPAYILGSIESACKKAGIPYGRNIPGGFVFHDLRHTFVTNARKAGISQSVIMKITGHSTAEMFLRYNAIDDADLENAKILLTQFMSTSKTAEKIPDTF